MRGALPLASTAYMPHQICYACKAIWRRWCVARVTRAFPASCCVIASAGRAPASETVLRRGAPARRTNSLFRSSFRSALLGASAPASARRRPCLSVCRRERRGSGRSRGACRRRDDSQGPHLGGLHVPVSPDAARPPRNRVRHFAPHRGSPPTQQQRLGREAAARRCTTSGTLPF